MIGACDESTYMCITCILHAATCERASEAPYDIRCLLVTNVNIQRVTLGGISKLDRPFFATLLTSVSRSAEIIRTAAPAMDGARIADKTRVQSPPVPLRVRPLRREWDVRNLRLALLLFLPTECRFRVSPKQRERLRDIIAPMRVHLPI